MEWENRRRDQKQARQSRSNAKVLLIVFHHEFFPTWSGSQRPVLLGGHEAFEGGKSEGRGLRGV
jgi:hypothetical protein